MFLRQPYQGSSRKLVIAFDVGTTFSGISYCILDPGEVPEIRGVSKFPAQDHVGGDNKIPSIVYYDQEGTVRAVGAETQQPHIIEEATKDQWIRLEWWKLHLRSKHLEASHFSDADLPPLPSGKTAVEVLGDFMRYLFNCAKEFITEAHASGSLVWGSLENNMEFILTHPNGWEGPQQRQIRNAAELGGLIPDREEGQSRIHLLTEGEASLHFCVTNILTSDTFSNTPIVCTEEPEEVEEVPEEQQQEHQGVIIIDAGGGTVDLSAYSMKLSPTSFREIAPAECRLQGSVFITYRAQAFLRATLANSKYGNEETLHRIVNIFDKTTKLQFRRADEPQYIQFGAARDKEPEYNIRSGQLKLSGEDVAKLFEPSVDEIIAAFEQQRKAASMPITCVFLVGGFAASDWLYSSLVKHMAAVGITFCRPNQHVNKAVADGAVSSYLDRLVSGRAARFTYGTGCNVTYNQFDSEHTSRRSSAFEGFGGLELPCGFEPILTKAFAEQQEFRKPFILEEFDRSRCGKIQVDVVAYRGQLANPRWMDTEQDSYTSLCTIRADASKLANGMRSHQLPGGAGVYYSIMFYVVLLFGLTELRAQISWVENGREVKMISRQPYQGRTRKLVLAFDVGTTYSGVSYCILDPGEIPTVHGVARYPAQEHIGGDNKIPSILYYDQQHVVRAVGAEALQPHIIEQAEDENWVKLEWWKLHLRAKHLSSSHIKDDDIPPLPQGLSAIRVLSDFMKYLFECARTYIVGSHASGSNMWNSLENQIEFVLTHPNGWEGPQQQQIRRAAELAELVSSGEAGQSRLHLLTEGEASLHFCVTKVLASDAFSTPIAYSDEPEEPDNQPGYQGIAIIDAGGGTVDMSVYSLMFSPSVSVEEIAPAECRLQGSVFVTLRAQQFLKSKLANSRYGTQEIVQQMTEEFDKSTKLRFRSAEDPQYIKFGTIRDKDPDYDIRSGQLKIAGNEVAKFFEPSVEAIAEVLRQQQGCSALPIKHAFLVGGYAASDFLFMSLQCHLAFSDVILCRPGNHVNKAVADGAISFYIDHLVTSRAAKFTYGVACAPEYFSNRADHLARERTVYRDITGCLRVPGAFRSILAKGTRVSEQQEFFHGLVHLGKRQSGCRQISVKVRAYRGSHAVPGWLDEEPSSFTELCTIHADTSKATEMLPQRRSETGRTYYSIHFKVILLFGLTELKAQLSWLENGVEKRSPASIVYDD
ncbi:hypothetical protein J3A83DRAFT_4367804 [Scleroderma citrinum]